MNNLAEYNGNALAITNAEIVENWQLGLLRSVAQSSLTWIEVMGNVFVNHTATQHVRKECPIVELRELHVTTRTVTEYSDTETNVVFRGVASCACGQLKNVTVESTNTIETAFARINRNK
jgi:hypothetical protein